MSQPQPLSDYVSMERVGFVNRRAVLDDIYARMRGARPENLPAFFITAPGGMGKTMLLQEVLRRCREGEWDGQQWFAASDVIDFYHLETHTLEGLAEAIDRVLQPGPQYLVNFRRRLQDYQERKYDLAGMLRELSELGDKVAQALVEDLNAMAQRKPVVLALDTAERLLYEPDEVQGILGVDVKETGIAVLPWLLSEFLPKLQNVVTLLAGRPEPETPSRLREDLRRSVGDRLVEIELSAFEPPDAQDYWEAVAQAAAQERHPEVAQRIRSVDVNTREVAWRYVGGRPILLSLVLDYLIRADQLLDDLKVPAEITRGKSATEIREIQERLERRLVREFQERGLPVDPAIKMLGWARRGMDQELLGRFLGISKQETGQMFETLRRLTFVKVRPADQRLFLHDEMYNLLWEHVLQHDEVGLRRTFATVLGYYEEKIRQARAGIEQASMAARREASVRLFRLMAEDVYYRLRYEPPEGFKTYYRYMKEAYWSNEDAAAMELRDELLEFLKEFDNWVMPGSSLLREHIVCECALRWIDRAERRGKRQDAVILAERIRHSDELDTKFQQAGILTLAELDALEGRARVYLGQDLERAQRLLEQARDQVDGFEPGTDEFEDWRKRMLLAEIYNDLGYALRVRGLLDQSIGFYRRAVLNWRQLGQPAEALHANTLNNLSWALAERGRYNEALRLCLDGLELRRKLGPRGPIAFSLNTLGLIEMRNDQPERGRLHCEQALAIFRDLMQPRGVGLACIALAEVYRRMALTPEAYTVPRQVELFRRAVERADEAVAIFSQEVPERLRLVEALIELGCDYREWARVRNHSDYPDGRDLSREELVNRSERALRGAMDEAGTDLPHKAVDAEVNLAWLYHYAGDDLKAQDTLARVLAREAVHSYLIREGQGVPQGEFPQPFFWTQLGKAHLLLGRISMRRYDEAEDKRSQLSLLYEAAEHFTLALAYDHLFADDFRDLRRGQEQIYNALKGFNVQYEFPAFIKGMEQATGKYNLKRPTHLEQFVTDAFGSPEELVRGVSP